MSTRIRKSVSDLKPYEPGRQTETPGVLKLNTNENPYPPSPKVADAIKQFSVPALRLYPEPTSLHLRRKLAALHETKPEQIFVGNGGDEVLALCTRAFVENDGSIGFFAPSYSLYPVLAAIRDVATKPVPLAADFAWQVPDGYESSLFFLTNPNAPTGILFSKEIVRAFCEKFPGLVVIDEAYVDFASADCIELALSMENVLVVRSMSKSYSLAGVRLGYAVGPAPCIEALFKVKDSYNVSRFAQTVAMAALDDLPHMRQNVEKIKATRDRVARDLRTLGCEVPASEANFVWVRPAGIPAATLHEELQKRNFWVRHFPGERTGEFVRITIGMDRVMDNLFQAMRELCAAAPAPPAQGEAAPPAQQPGQGAQ